MPLSGYRGAGIAFQIGLNTRELCYRRWSTGQNKTLEWLLSQSNFWL